MTILDATLEFSDAQAETTQAAHDSDNVLNMNIADANLGAGTPKWVVAEVSTLFESGGAATLACELQDSATVGGTYTTLAGGQVHVLATLVKGFKLLVIPLPAEHLQFVKLIYTIASADMTAGAINAYITTIPQTA